jgi:hypothetical protein
VIAFLLRQSFFVKRLMLGVISGEIGLRVTLDASR